MSIEPSALEAYGETIRYLESGSLEEFRHASMAMAALGDDEPSMNRRKNHSDADLEAIRRRMIHNMKREIATNGRSGVSYVSAASQPVSDEFRNIPFLEQDEAALCRKVRAARGRRDQEPHIATAAEVR